MKKNNNIIVVGDVMLDGWINGKLSKPSAEVPIKIFEKENNNFSLGGAGNLVLNLKKLNLKLLFYTSFGRDAAGYKIKKLLKNEKIKYINVENKKTPVKNRYFYKNIQIFREDIEENYINKKVGSLMLKKVKEKDIVILSDYKKGVIYNEFHSKLIKKKCITFVDPKNKPFFYRNAFLVKPNMKKFNEWCGKFSKSKAFLLIKRMKWEWLIITDGSRGVHVFNKYNIYNHYKVPFIKNPNVVGAGDIFLSSLVFFYNKNYNIFNCAELASYASTMCVKEKQIRYIDKKKFKKNIVFTNGVFDLLHPGHKKLLRFASSIGKKLIVGLNSDRSVKLNKGKNRPFNSLIKRFKKLKETKLIDKIYVFNEKTPIKLIKKIKPDVIVKGSDYNFKNVVGSKICNVILFDKEDNFSTTNLIKNLK